MATAQLQLIAPNHSWKLDERTLEVGRAGIARAREALASAHAVDNPLDASYAECKAKTYQSAGLKAASNGAKYPRAGIPAQQVLEGTVQQQQIALAA